ncbi:MAG TPA: hypothetical protein VG206_02890 [Terriglobia bacterium]|nr:hypothetical protein [Terriglobia bacterium]
MKLAELIIQMSANTASLERDFKKASSMANSFANNVKSVLSVGIGGVGLEELGSQLKGLVDRANEVGEALYKAREITGLSAESLSGLRAKAQQTGEEFGGLTTTLSKLQKNIEAGIISPGSAAGKTLIALLGSSKALKELGLEPVDQQVQTVLKSLFGLTNANERNYAATTLLGRGWQGAAETLRAFAESGDKLKSVAAGVGGLYSDAEISQLHRYGEEWNRLETTISNAAVTIGAALEVFASDAYQGFKAQITGSWSVGDAWEGSYGVIPKGGFKKNSSLADLMSQAGAAGGKSWGDRMDASSAEFWQKYNAGMGDAAEKFPPAIKGLTELRAAFDAATAAGKKNSIAQDEWNASMEKALELDGKVPYLPNGFTNPALTLPPWQGTDDKSIQQLYGNIGGGLNTPANSAASGYLSSIFQDGSTDPSTGKNKKLDQFQKQALQVGQTMTDSFISMVAHGDSFSRILTTLTTQLAEFLVKAVLFKAISNAMTSNNDSSSSSDSSSGSGGGGGFLSGLLGAIFGGGKAAGGPVTSGSLYMVGESGPELFAPGMSGSIIPNGAGGSAGGGTINIDARGADAGVEHRIMRAMDAVRKQTLGQALVQQYEYNARQS